MKKYFFYVIAALMVIPSCKKPLTYRKLLTAGDFPSKPGTWWFYKDGNQTDTIKIVDIITIQNTPVQRLVRVNSMYSPPDTSYMIITDTCIRFSRAQSLVSYYLNINLPVIENTPWGYPVDGPNYATQVQDITVNNVSYNATTYLHRSSPYSFGYQLNESLWIVKGIGIVKHYDDSFGANTYHYELVSYYIAP